MRTITLERNIKHHLNGFLFTGETMHQAPAVRAWVRATLQRYASNPGLTPRPYRIARMFVTRRDEGMRDQIALLIYGAFVVRRDLEGAHVWWYWMSPAAQTAVAQIPGLETRQ